MCDFDKRGNLMHPLVVSKDNIWQYQQNKPSLIAKDLEQYGVPRRLTMSVLLARGVFKWLAVRRDLIKLKNIWKERIKQTLAEIQQAKSSHEQLRLMYLRGYLKAYEECRKEVRALCHSERWRAPEFDEEAQKFLKKLEQETLITHSKDYTT